MRSSIVLVSLMGALVTAFPHGNILEKKAIVTDIVIETVYVTVTAGQPLPTSSPEKIHTHTVQHTVVVEYTPSASSTISSSTSTPPPPPPPAPTTTAPPPPPPTTTAPPPPPPTTTEPAPVVPTTVAAPVVSTQAAPVVQPAPVVAPAAAAPSDYASTAIYHHNIHRANHSAPDVSWDDQLAKNALATANRCVFAHDMTENGGGYGQNLAAYGTSENIGSLDLSNLVANAITDSWYNGEAANVIYGEDSPPINGPEFLHFTQVVWKASTKIGCATVQCAAGTIFSMPSLYTVCDYGSQGNVLGEFISQVSRPRGLAGVSAAVN